MRTKKIVTQYRLDTNQVQTIGSWVKPSPRSYLNNIETLNLSRSDVVRNPKTETGWRKPSPYTANVIESDCVFGSLYVRDYKHANKHEIYAEGRFGARTWGAGPDIPVPALPDLPYPGLYSKGIVDARNNVANSVGFVLESLYEARKTVAFLGESASSINRFITASERKYFRDAARALKLRPGDPRVKRAVKLLSALPKGAGTVGSAFLAFSFGVKPIISDMVTAAIALSGGASVRCVGKSLVLADKTVSTSRRTCHVTSWGPSLHYDISTEKVSGIYTRLDYEVTADYLRQLTSFGLLNSPELVWAVQPYSWLVDFVLPISDVLSAMTATHGLRFKGGTQTTFRTAKSSLTGIDVQVQVGPGIDYRVENFEWVKPAPSVRRHMDRKVLKSDAIPMPLYVKDPFHSFAAAASLSLLAVKLKQHFK